MQHSICMGHALINDVLFRSVDMQNKEPKTKPKSNKKTNKNNPSPAFLTM